MISQVLIMNIGTWLLAIASVPQILSIWKNRRDLRGYSRPGSLILLIGMICIGIAFFMMSDYVSLGAGIVQIIMWGMAVRYSRC